MKRRIVVFGWIWTFALNALWVPGGLDYGYLRSVFFPAWYLFLIGLLIAVVHEGLVTRLPRLWISAATSIALTELCLLLFNGKTAGLFLAVPMILATVLASGAAALPRLTRLRIVPLLGCLLLLISGMTFLYTITDSWLRRGERLPVVTSPDAAYRAYTRPEGFVAAMPPAIYVGPRYAPKIWFSARVAEGYEPHWLDNQRLSYSPDSTTKFLQYGRFLQVQVEPTIKNSKYPTQSGYR